MRVVVGTQGQRLWHVTLIFCLLLLVGVTYVVVQSLIGVQASESLVLVDAPMTEAIWAGERAVRDLTVRNNSSRPVNVQSFLTSCGCLRIEPSSLCVPPRGQSRIRAYLYWPIAQFEPDLPHVGAFSISILPVVTTAIDTVRPIRIRGALRHAMLLSEKRLSFTGPDAVRNATPVQKTLIIHPTIPLSDLEATCATTDAQLHLAYNSSSSDYVLRVRPIVRDQCGIYTFPVALQMRSKTHGPLPAFEVEVTVEMINEDAIEIIPPVLVLGPQELGGTFRRHCIIRSSSPLKLVHYTDGNHDLTVVQDSIDPAQLWVEGSITQVGKQTLRVPLVFHDGHGRELPGELHASYYGLRKQL